MNKRWCLGLVLLVSFTAQSQDSSLAFDEKRMVWCGIDFSECRLVGSDAFSGAERIKNYFFNNWNQLMINESHKYDFKKYYAKNEQINALEVVEVRNEKPVAANLIIDEDYTFEEGQLESIVSGYKGVSDESDLGLVYVVETFDQKAERAKIHVVFFNTATGKIAWTKRYHAKPGGMGFRNYWAGAIMSALKYSASDFLGDAKLYAKGKLK